MEEQEIVRLVQSMLASVQTEIAVVSVVNGDSATVKRQGQSVATRALPAAKGLNLSTGDRVVLLRPGGDLNAAVIVAKLSGAGLYAADADKVDGIHFRVQGGVLQWSQNGTQWHNA